MKNRRNFNETPLERRKKLFRLNNSGPFGLAGPTAQEILAFYGSAAHLYLAGVGTIETYVTGNYLDSTGTTAATVTDPAGLSLDALDNTYSATYLSTSFSSWRSDDIVLASLADTTAETITSANPQTDLSVKNNSLTVVGTITKTPVATGSSLVYYTGFSTSNYLSQPSTVDYYFGAGEMCVLAWVNMTSLASVSVVVDSGLTGISGEWTLRINSGGALVFTYQNVGFATSSLIVPLNTPSLIGYFRRGGLGYFTLNGVVQANTSFQTNNLTRTGALLKFGFAGTSPLLGSMALVRISKTGPTTADIEQIYANELPLFQAGAGPVTLIAGTAASPGPVWMKGISAHQGTVANQPILNLDGSIYHWDFDATDSLTATFPAGYEAATIIDAVYPTGQVTLSAQNIVGTYAIGPSINTSARIILRNAPTAGELAVLQGFANALSGN